MEITVENFSYSNLRKWLENYSHQDKVEFAIYCAEFVIDIYERHNDSDAPRLAIKAAKTWVESPTEDNRKSAYAAYAAAYAAAAADDAPYTAAVVSDLAAAAADDDDYADSADFAAAAAADSAAAAEGTNIKSKIIAWFSKNYSAPNLKPLI